MRETQFIGLNNEGKKYLERYVYPEGTFLGWGDKLTGMFEEDVYTCKTYVHAFKRRAFEEYLQCDPWSSGPMLFLALRWVDTKEPVRETLWYIDEVVKDQEYDIETGKYWV